MASFLPLGWSDEAFSERCGDSLRSGPEVVAREQSGEDVLDRALGLGAGAGSQDVAQIRQPEAGEYEGVIGGVGYVLVIDDFKGLQVRGKARGAVEAVDALAWALVGAP
ncbi:hypothetical protein ACFVUW_10440 [Streptomyces xiamenensis]|uniref:hypothetical protein n=1 Tax=Streptomyces xiamenensis TaxID=408015 RepID=UPI0036E99D36